MGKLIGIVGVSIDISERKRQENSLIELTRQLERQSNVFNTTLSSITDFAYIFDREATFHLRESAAARPVGTEARSKRWARISSTCNIPTTWRCALQQQIQQVFGTGQSLRDETPYTSTDRRAKAFTNISSLRSFAADGTVEAGRGFHARLHRAQAGRNGAAREPRASANGDERRENLFLGAEPRNAAGRVV